MARASWRLLPLTLRAVCVVIRVAVAVASIAALAKLQSHYKASTRTILCLYCPQVT